MWIWFDNIAFMRVNIYAEEITDEVQSQEKTADTGNTFYAIRFILKSPESLHFNEKDDDRSAVTFWVPGSKNKGLRKEELQRAFEKALSLLRSF
jgi:hypothetical protein